MMNNETNTAPSKFGKAEVSLIILALITAGTIIALKMNKEPVNTRVQASVDSASRMNQNALQSFEMEIRRIKEKHKDMLNRTAEMAANEASGYSECCRIVYLLALDKLMKENRTETYLESKITPITGPAIDSLSRNIQEALGSLESDLQESSFTLANDLAAMMPDASAISMPETSSYPDKDKALRSLGIDSLCLGAAVAFDIVALRQLIAGGITKKVTVMATRMFGKQVGTLAGSAALPFLDGPLPIGDILALGGIAWTAYDIYDSRKDFEKQLQVALNNMMDETMNDLHEQALDHASKMVKEYQRIQDEIAMNSEEALLEFPANVRAKVKNFPKRCRNALDAVSG